MTEPEFGAGLWNFATYKDRYASDGYGDARSTLDQIDLAAEVGDIRWVDITYPFSEGVTLDDVKAKLAEKNIKCIGITPEIYLREHCKGAFTNPDPVKRASSMKIMNEAADIVRELGAKYVKIWPGQDGFDYPLQADPRRLWELSVEGMQKVAGPHPDMPFAIEYKPKEPRTHMFFSDAARTLLAIGDIGLDNVGILLDFGHSLYGGESPAAAAELCLARGRLIDTDLNDNLRGWDDDMTVGSVHLLETIEFLFTLKRAGWEKAWKLDQFPFREDPVEAARASIRMLRALLRLLDRIDADELAAARERQDALAAQKLVHDILLGELAAAD